MVCSAAPARDLCETSPVSLDVVRCVWCYLPGSAPLPVRWCCLPGSAPLPVRWCCLPGSAPLPVRWCYLPASAPLLVCWVVLGRFSPAAGVFGWYLPGSAPPPVRVVLLARCHEEHLNKNPDQRRALLLFSFFCFFLHLLFSLLVSLP